MRRLLAKVLIWIGLIGGLIAAAALANFIWGLDWGTGRRSGIVGTVCLILFPGLLWAVIFFFFAWVVSLVDEEP